ncbi:MAG: gliding motility-associated C-terminal domain-containing protein [Crocinitomicaceae bacterium]|nr:gliding motility-associated C-terminal domain-containing protein [Crocinitomicaceae bacterium]
MKLLFSLLLSIVFSAAANAQNLEWLVSGGGLKSDKATHIVVDDAGNSYVTGYYNEQAQFGSFDTGFSFSSSKEVFVAKIDPAGNYLWVKNGLNYYDDRGLGLCLDPAGNVYVTGTCWGNLDWGTLSNGAGSTDQIFVVKMDNNGNEIWMKNAGNPDGSVGFSTNENGLPQTLYQDDHGQDLASDSQGNIYVTGFLSNIDTNPHDAFFDGITVPLIPEDSIAFLAKLDNSGTWLWVETFQGIYQHRDNAVAVDDDDNVYVTGGFRGTKNFGTTTLTSFGKEDIYVIKYDGNGAFQWVTQAGSIGESDRGDGIVYGNDGHMYVTGEFRGFAAFGTDTLNNYGGDQSDKDCFVAKMTKDGVWKWAEKAGSSQNSDRGTGICANTSGNIFVSGQFRGEAKFSGSDITLDSGSDSVQAFVAAIDTLGNWRWAKAGGGSGFDRGADVDVDEDCNVYFTGYFTNSFTFDNAQTVNAVAGKETFAGKMSDACFGYAPPPPPGPEEEFCEILESNVFTPNGDEVNDELVFSDNCNMEGTVLIFNRWGEIVYESNDLLETWDGTAKSGQMVNAGTYFYNIEVRSQFGQVEKKSGFITVII